MPDTPHDDLLAGFTAPQPYTMETVAGAPRAPGVHVVLDRGVVIYVGRTRRGLRDRLRQHLTGNRDSSVLHDQVGQLLDTPDNAASAADIAGWLGRREVRWQETDDPTAEEQSSRVINRLQVVLTGQPLGPFRSGRGSTGRLP